MAILLYERSGKMIKLKELVEDKIDIKKKSEADHLSQEVRKVQEEMAATLHNFENTTEPDLIFFRPL